MGHVNGSGSISMDIESEFYSPEPPIHEWVGSGMSDLEQIRSVFLSTLVSHSKF